MLTKEELTRRVVEANAIRRWYQKVPYGDFEYPFKTHFEDGKTCRASYGSGRWHNYIEPTLGRLPHALDLQNSTLCEVGCSAGLFLLYAWRRFTFGRLIGVEAANGGYTQLLITKDYYDDMPLVTHKVALGRLTDSIADSEAPEIDMNTFPMVDVTLMSCIHYHMEINYLKDYLKKLASKSLYLLLLTDENAGGPINATSEFFREAIIGSDDWRMCNALYTKPEQLKSQPPCKDLTVLIYESNLLKRLLVKECYEKQMGWHKGKGGKHEGWYMYAQTFYNDVFPYFIKGVVEKRITRDNYRNSLVYKWQREGRFGTTAWSEDISSERVLSYINIIETMKDHGQEQPIGLQEHLNMVDPWDGWHRVAVAHYLGFKYIYGVDVIPER
jgi:hypothetical protein